MPGYELVGEEELDSLKEIFSASRGVLFAHGFGPRRNEIYRVRAFEAAASKRFKCKHVTAVTSGTAAQFVALKALGVGPGDEVITQAFTFVATVEAILQCGATPVIVDCDETLNMCPKALKQALTKNTKCIVPVHMLGAAARMEEIMAVANGIPVAEDACESVGAEYRGRALGTLGKVGFFSLDFGKMITTGEGGLILTNDDEVGEFVAAYHDHGHRNLPDVSRGQDSALVCGFNFRMSEMQGAVGIAQLAKLDFILKKNREHKAYIKSRLRQELAGKVTFREITDEAGDGSDTLIFFLPSAELGAKAAANLSRVGVDSKNIPSAMNWHFAGNWPQCFGESERYRNSFAREWQATRVLLERAIALPILVKVGPNDLDQLADKVIRVVRELVQ